VGGDSELVRKVRPNLSQVWLSRAKKRGVEPTVPNHLVPSLVSFALRQGVAPEQLFARVGRTLESARQVGTQFSVREVELLFESLRDEVGEPALALLFGREVDAEKLGLFGLLLSTSSTPRSSLAALSEFKGLLHPLLDLTVHESDEHTYLRYAAADGGPIGHKPYYAEALLSTVHHAAQLFYGDLALPVHVSFRHRAPSYVRAYEQIFRCSVRFEQPVDELCYRAPFLDIPSRGASDSHRALRVEAARKLDGERSPVIRQVTRVVSARLSEPDLTLDDVARALAVSGRSLQRSLKLAGTGYRELRDGVRYERACQLLSDPNVTTEATALALGYRDRGNFVRAFSRWSGQSPSHYRRGTSGAK